MIRLNICLSLAVLFCACPPRAVVPAPSIVHFSASPDTLPHGGGVVTLSWTQADGEHATIDQGIGDVSNRTSLTVTVTETKSFTLTVSNSTGEASAVASVSVAPQPGSFDQSFGANGVVVSSFGVNILARGMAATTSGEFVVVGSMYLFGATSDFLVVRYDRNGQLEPTFGIAGQMTTDLDGGFNDTAEAVDLTDTGRIVVAGSSFFGFDSDTAIVRYRSKGELDTEFSGDGKLVLPWVGVDHATAVKALAGGETLVVGTYDELGARDFSAQKLRPNGELDHSFAGNGKLHVDFDGGYDWASAMLVQNDGKIVISGSSTVGGESDGVMTRLNVDGSMDLTFATAGLLRLVEAQGDSLTAMTTQATGEIVAAGTALNPTSGVAGLLLVRLGEDGQRDLLFGTGGVVTNWLSGARRFEPVAVAVQADGRIVVGGWADSLGLGDRDLAVVRYNGDGSVDSTFGSSGVVTVDMAGTHETSFGLAIQSDGKIVVAGANELSQIVLARLNP